MLLEGQWFALQVRTRTENQVATILRGKGYEEFLPTHTVKRKNLSLQAPLFPGYIFCRVKAYSYGLIVTTPGVIRIVEFGGKPAPIDPEEIQSLQLITNARVPICVWKGLTVGDQVRIEKGPLSGAVGILTSLRPNQRLLVSISLMMRTVVAEIEPEWVASTTRNPAPSVQQVETLRYGT